MLATLYRTPPAACIVEGFQGSRHQRGRESGPLARIISCGERESQKSYENGVLERETFKDIPSIHSSLHW